MRSEVQVFPDPPFKDGRKEAEELWAKRDFSWGYSSAGRAPALQAGGQEFEPPYLHHNKKRDVINT